MDTITIPKIEYRKLRQQASAYRKFTEKLFKSVVKNPVGDVVDDFRKTGLYGEDFLSDLEDGLSKSSYAKESGI